MITLTKLDEVKVDLSDFCPQIAGKLIKYIILKINVLQKHVPNLFLLHAQRQKMTF
jgi:hypothetical protein